MAEAIARLPSDPITMSLDDCVYGYEYDGGVEGSVREASKTKRAAAISYFAREMGRAFREVRCRTTYGRSLTRQEVWDDYGRERWEDNLEDEVACPKCGAERGAACNEEGDAEPCAERLALVPDEPPSDWESDEQDPAWTTCKAGTPGAVRIYICEVRE